MILLQPQVDPRTVKVDWYFTVEEKPREDDGRLREIYPSFIINERLYIWSSTEW